MTTGKNKIKLSWAEFRFSIIGVLLADPPERGQLREADNVKVKGTHFDHAKGTHL